MNPYEAPDSTLLPRDEATGEPRPQTERLATTLVTARSRSSLFGIRQHATW